MNANQVGKKGENIEGNNLNMDVASPDTPNP
jgi:hypothetical protein